MLARWVVVTVITWGYSLFPSVLYPCGPLPDAMVVVTGEVSAGIRTVLTSVALEDPGLGWTAQFVSHVRSEARPASCGVSGTIGGGRGASAASSPSWHDRAGC